MRKKMLRLLGLLTFAIAPLLSCGTVTEDLGFPPYYGESDLTTPQNAFGWWGLRAYGNSQVGTNLADVWCPALNAIATVTSNSNGDFDVASLNTMCPSDSVFYINKLYDQSGFGYDLNAGAQTAAPQLKLNCIGRLPCMLMDGTSNSVLTASIAQTYAQPLTLTAVVAYTDANSPPVINTGAIIGNDPSANASMMLSNLNGSLTASMTSNSTATLNSASLAVNSYNFIVSIFSNVTSSLYVNNSLIYTGDAGTNGLGPVVLVGKSAGANPNYLKGQLFELAFWPFPFTPLQVQIFTTSVTNYWGFAPGS